jgi:hypothetical protein
MGIALHHGARELGPHRVDAELAPGDEELLGAGTEAYYGQAAT